MRSGDICASASMTSADKPLRGGSTTIASSFSPRLANSSAAAPASAQKNSAFVTPFHAAFSRAFVTASGTISTP